MSTLKEEALKELDVLIERWKTNYSPYKDYAFGYVMCMYTQNIITMGEGVEILRDRGI